MAIDILYTDFLQQENTEYYIEKYNGYTNGYNCTKGGDGGILGYKMTDEQKEKWFYANRTISYHSINAINFRNCNYNFGRCK